ncbi:hypothetical protein [Rheinheimera sp.]|uniref:hypothetical protein n=1 Tax=Rheinheimera sp. TaxID=1869214 RepID=UPI002734C63E|nr:hypothetical protein [Rheinheimera sp.]MDP2716973.1 hypothetical protein [Rheinheimera sp.]
MMLILAVLSLAICALAVYLLAPQQQLLQKKLPALWLLLIAVFTASLALRLLASGYGFWPGFYLALTLLMLYWVTLPLLIRRKGATDGV